MLRVRKTPKGGGGTGRRQIIVTTISNFQKKKRHNITSQLTNKKYPRGLERWLSR